MKKPLSPMSLDTLKNRASLGAEEKRRMRGELIRFAATTIPLEPARVPPSVHAPMIPPDPAVVIAVAALGTLGVIAAGVAVSAALAPKRTSGTPKSPSEARQEQKAVAPVTSITPTLTPTPMVRTATPTALPVPKATEPHTDNGLHIGRDGGSPRGK